MNANQSRATEVAAEDEGPELSGCVVKSPCPAQPPKTDCAREGPPQRDVSKWGARQSVGNTRVLMQTSPGLGWHVAPQPDPNTGRVLALTSETDLGFKVLLGPFCVVHLKTESNGPFISTFCEKSRSGMRTVKETRESFFFSSFFSFLSDLRHW